MNDYLGATDECHGEDGGENEEERALRRKIPPRFVPEIFAADIKE